MASSRVTTGRDGFNWPLLFGFWALIAAVFVARAILGSDATPLVRDTDDAMRLTMVHDFLAGQGWYDLTQHRLNTPYGAEIHWSRLIDLPEAALLFVLRPFAGSFADILAAYVWPLGLMGGLLALSSRVAVRLGGREAMLPALALPAVSLVTMAEFAPGRFDHHSAQILLTFVLVLCSIEALQRPRFALGAGLAAATAIAIGIEGLPMVMAATLVYGLMWVAVPARADALRNFGASFGLMALVHLALALPPERWLVPACDAISIAYVASAMLLGLAFLVLSLLPFGGAGWRVRLGLGAVAGAAVAGLAALLFPACLAGPYGTLDPWLSANWIERISEAAPWWQSLLSNPVYPLATGLPPLLALVAGAWRVLRGERQDRGEWLIYLAFLLIAILVMALQIRAARIATSLAVPACAWLIIAARVRYLDRASPGRILGLVTSWLGSAGLAIGLLVSAALLPFPDYAAAIDDRSHNRRNTCLIPSAFAGLAALPRERVMSPVDLGAHLLLFTPHEVVAAPYHRNQQGVRDAFDFFNGPIAAARTILEQRGVTLVVICPAMREIRGLVPRSDDSFGALYARHALPDWLVEQPNSGSALNIYAVMPRS